MRSALFLIAFVAVLIVASPDIEARKKKTKKHRRPKAEAPPAAAPPGPAAAPPGPAAAADALPVDAPGGGAVPP
ncbi:hypothetical protein EYR38_008334 [Pleurotus pulmonarius]|nr:hypothetical protein EYR38_008334 [Pleurotus pulmonarius]